MRELTHTELEAASGGLTRPRPTTRRAIFLQLVVAIVRRVANRDEVKNGYIGTHE
jgi:hypothetical protein